MPLSLCANPTCPNPATWRGRCQTHAQARIRETRSRNAKVYNSARWRNTRKHYLANHPLCERCNSIATDVHHIRDIQAGGNIWSMDNLEALCHACHSQTTRREQLAAKAP